MIELRKLEVKDVPLMLEWMHDEESKTIFQNDFSSIDEEKAKKFVLNSFDEENHHFAIVNEYDEYLGTISLKHIDRKNSIAEYAISTRKKIRGTGGNFEATQLILKYAFEDLKLNKVYLNVLSSNVRAIKFYLKNGFVYEGTFRNHLFVNDMYQDLQWYAIMKEDFIEK